MLECTTLPSEVLCALILDIKENLWNSLYIHTYDAVHPIHQGDKPCQKIQFTLILHNQPADSNSNVVINVIKCVYVFVHISGLELAIKHVNEWKSHVLSNFLQSF